VSGPRRAPRYDASRAWFAVDAAGQVGIFDAGARGAVPIGAAMDPDELVEGTTAFDTFTLDAARYAQVLAREDHTRLDPDLVDSKRTARGSRVIAIIDRAREATAYRGGVDPRSFEATLGDDLHVLRGADPRIVASRAPLDAERAGALAEDETVLGAAHDYEIREWVRHERDTGVFRYRNEQPEATGLYVLHERPSRPLCVDDLSEATRDALREVTFDVRFGDHGRLQLGDHFRREQLVLWSARSALFPPRDLRPPITDDELQRDARRFGVTATVVIVLVVWWLLR